MKFPAPGRSVRLKVNPLKHGMVREITIGLDAVVVLRVEWIIYAGHGGESTWPADVFEPIGADGAVEDVAAGAWVEIEFSPQPLAPHAWQTSHSSPAAPR